MELTDYKIVDLSKLVKANWNYKEDDHDIAQKLKANIKTNGQIENLIIRDLGNDSFEVVNGNHRLDVMNELGIKSAMCCNLGMITVTQAKRVAIETNETKFPNDPLKLMEVVKDLGAEFSQEELTITLPYSEDEIRFFIEHEVTETPTLTTDEFMDGMTEEDKISESKPEGRPKKLKLIPASCPACKHNFDIEV